MMYLDISHMYGATISLEDGTPHTIENGDVLYDDGQLYNLDHRTYVGKVAQHELQEFDFEYYGDTLPAYPIRDEIEEEDS